MPMGSWGTERSITKGAAFPTVPGVLPGMRGARGKGWAHPAHLSKLGQHDDDGGIVLPEHAPEVLGALCQRPLRSYVGLLLSG